MVKITFSKIARSDLKDIVDFIKKGSVKFASIEKVKIINAINMLIKQPFMGRVFPELNDENYRELIFQNYRIIYKVKSETAIYILTIHHHSRLINKNPAFKIEE